MSFLAIDAEKSLFTLQRNQLQLENCQIMSQINLCTKQMQYIQQGNDDYDKDPEYVYYEKLDELLENEKDSIESQITALDNEISGLKQLVNNNIKNSCTLNLIGG